MERLYFKKIEPIQIVVFKLVSFNLAPVESATLNLYRLLYLNRPLTDSNDCVRELNLYRLLYLNVKKMSKYFFKKPN